MLVEPIMMQLDHLGFCFFDFIVRSVRLLSEFGACCLVFFFLFFIAVRRGVCLSVSCLRWNWQLVLAGFDVGLCGFLISGSFVEISVT